MSGSSELSGTTRRAVLKAVGASVAVGAAGTASAHEKWDSHPNDSEIEGGSPSALDSPGNTVGAQVMGYHSLGSVGSETTNGSRNPHYGAQTEIRTRGDYAYVSFFSSDAPTPGRGMAIVDISSYNDAETDAEAEAANMSVLSFVRNNSTGTAVMDLKVSDDGDYVFLGTQPLTALFTTGPNGEATDPTPNLDGNSFTEAPGAVVAVDVSDKGNPETVGAFQVSGLGVHNLFHHRIGQEEYVFAIHDQPDGTGMYVLRFDRTTGQLEPVNLWTLAGDARQGEYAGDTAYIHDVEVQDDPVTGTPTAYLGYWGQGLQVLDVSNPEDITQIGQFDMSACHFTSPAPTLYETPGGETKRVAVASQEIGSNGTRTGRIHLVDVSGIYEADAEVMDVPDDLTVENGVAQLETFDTWEWQNLEEDTDTPDAEEIQFGNFQLSPHNSDVVIDQDGELWIHQSHYHGGIRYLKGVEEDDGTLGLTQEGFSRPVYDTPKASRMQGLSEVVPNCWAAVESNGVTFASDINQGVHAVKADGIEYGGGPAVVDAVRSDDGSLFTGGQTDRIDIDVRFVERYDEVLVRDRLPASWDAYDDDAYETYEEGAATYVEFDAAASGGDTLSYFADVGGGSDAARVGPVEVSTDGGETWQALPGTFDTNFVVGAPTNLVAGTAAATVGMAAHQRDRIVEGARDLLGREE
ncbi:LVIVD repeat-containing protein [Natronomonas marina]|uniref:LVIVD repeat-containing protein n=1 Tax=Natronomonas marina TaxID=2961939 RepID=UPI0020C9DE90|nr:hypothetical protein [Natronomonas marina]